jgi:hypothetical protein
MSVALLGTKSLKGIGKEIFSSLGCVRNTSISLLKAAILD